MASIKILRYGTFQLYVKNKLLPKTHWVTFGTCEQAEADGDQLDRLPALGSV